MSGPSRSPSTLANHAIDTHTPLRRSTRSSTAASPNTKSPLDLSKYAFKAEKQSSTRRPTATSPTTPPSSKRSRVRIEPSTPDQSKVERPPTPKSSSKKPMPLLALEKAHPAPPRWEEQYRLIERMRKGIVAPVDDMGCERPRTADQVDPKTLRFHVLISLMLSSQTKDAVTSQAVTNLHQTLPGGLTAESLASATEDIVQSCINKVGFWRRKTEYIQDAARKLLEREGEDKGDVPNTLEGLCELKGVGPKMAFLALQCAWDINAGIGVDVHVHRITNRLRWHKPQTTNPEQTRLNLQSWLPSELHKPINPMLVGFGQVICLPVGPRCDLCLLGQRKLCPSRVSNVKAEGRKEVSYTFTTEEEGESGSAKVEIKYEEVLPEQVGDLVKDEESEDLVDSEVPLQVKEERVLEILDVVDGTKEIGS